MNLQDLQLMFNRALAHTFSQRKLLFVFCTLALCGLLVVFFRALSLEASNWIATSFLFLPIFLCAGVLLAAGIVIIRIYHDEVKKRPLSYTRILKNSWELMIGASYISIPIILSYLVLWMLLGVFFLLNEVPWVGGVFAVLLAFAPFLINFCSLVLCLINLLLLFFMTPIFAFRGLNRMQVLKVFMNRIQEDIFSNLVLVIIALLPITFFVLLLTAAALFTGTITYASQSNLQIILNWFIIMIPFTALLTPAVIFFFNFAAEAHVFFQRKED
jgi:hypothetical protein